jgi:hypothetical protein
MRWKRILLSAVALVAVAAPVTVFGAAPAGAQVGNTNCALNTFCLLYPALFNGKPSAYTAYPIGTSVPDLSTEVFNGGGSGANGFNLPVVGNIGSAVNHALIGTGMSIVLCSGTNYTGVCRIITPDSTFVPINDPYLHTVHSFHWAVG